VDFGIEFFVVFHFMSHDKNYEILNLIFLKSLLEPNFPDIMLVIIVYWLIITETFQFPHTTIFQAISNAVLCILYFPQ
jgi:hypothetical protein